MCMLLQLSGYEALACYYGEAVLWELQLEEHVRFLLVGAYAVAVYGYPRATKDIDIFVRAAPGNAASLMKALARFALPFRMCLRPTSQRKESCFKSATVRGESIY
jgi:hypothetical protein